MEAQKRLRFRALHDRKLALKKRFTIVSCDLGGFPPGQGLHSAPSRSKILVLRLRALLSPLRTTGVKMMTHTHIYCWSKLPHCLVILKEHGEALSLKLSKYLEKAIFEKTCFCVFFSNLFFDLFFCKK